MVALGLLLSSLLVISTEAFPVASPNHGLQFPHYDPTKILCQLPILKKYLCPRTGLTRTTVATPLGTAQGTPDPSGAVRFAVKYANAQRWAQSAIVSSWGLPAGAINSTLLPLACPQPGVDSSAYTEDCLSMVLYVPPSVGVGSNVPTLMWIHGGSFVVGSATGPGLDGSQLAIATNSIVAVVQYRLGALGFMSPNGGTNNAVKDVINGLQFLRKVLPSFGGQASSITIAGQSAGATMIRALLATPSASSLFKSAILQSDPMDYGHLKPSTQTTLQSNYNSLVGCSATDSACWSSLSLDQILEAQNTLYGTAPSLDPSTGPAQPIRPVVDGSLITSPLDSTAPFPSVNKPILVTSVLHEAGFAIYQQFDDEIPEEWFPGVTAATLGDDRMNTIVSSSYYPAPAAVDGSVDGRPQLQTLGTDYLWKCSGWTFARNWVQHGGSAYVGEYQVGASYPGNEAVPFCTEGGHVCHQDDIQIVFGTVASPNPGQSALVKEMQARYKNFLNTGNPNASGYATWNKATSSDVKPLPLGKSTPVVVGACTPSFWGTAVQYDYQFYNI